MKNMIKSQVVALPNEIASNEKVKVSVIPDVWTSIINLHSICGSTEWSGCIFYIFEEGDTETLPNAKLKVVDFLLMNIGTSMHTSFEGDSSIATKYIEVVDKYPNTKVFQGLIHTHHDMNVFFSQTDKTDLLDNAKIYTTSQYLSIIANFKEKIIGKVAIPGKENVEKKFVTATGREIVYNTTEKAVNTFDCEITTEPFKAELEMSYGGQTYLFNLDDKYEKLKKQVEAIREKNRKSFAQSKHYSPVNRNESTEKKVYLDPQLGWDDGLEDDFEIVGDNAQKLTAMEELEFSPYVTKFVDEIYEKLGENYNIVSKDFSVKRFINQFKIKTYNKATFYDKSKPVFKCIIDTIKEDSLYRDTAKNTTEFLKALEDNNKELGLINSDLLHLRNNLKTIKEISSENEEPVKL